MKGYRLVVLAALLLMTITVIYPIDCFAEGREWAPTIRHTPPSEIRTGESHEINITVEAYNITSVYLNWIDVEERVFQRRMERDPQDNLTWTYTIPPQEEEGEINYNFTVRKELQRWHHPEEEEFFSITVEDQEAGYTDFRYFAILGAVLITALILVEMIRRRTPTDYKKNYKQPIENEEDRWRRL